MIIVVYKDKLREKVYVYPFTLTNNGSYPEVEGKKEGSFMINTAYCYMCDQDVDVIIKKEIEVHCLKGADVRCEVENVYCQKCGAQVYIPMINDRNLDCINLTYRKQHGIITIHEIEALLDRYDIGAKPLAHLLGWGKLLSFAI
jgi:hypothetical protein